MITIELQELVSVIKYYFQNCERRKKEITRYCALGISDREENDEMWMQVYEHRIEKR